MKAKLLILSAIVALSLTTPAFARTRVAQTRNGRAVVTNTGNHGNHWRSRSSVFWNVGIGVPFYGGYYGGGYPYYGSYYSGGYPYGSYGYGYYPYGYGYSSNYYDGSNYTYFFGRTIYRGFYRSVDGSLQVRAS